MASPPSILIAWVAFSLGYAAHYYLNKKPSDSGAPKTCDKTGFECPECGNDECLTVSYSKNEVVGCVSCGYGKPEAILGATRCSKGHRRDE